MPTSNARRAVRRAVGAFIATVLAMSGWGVTAPAAASSSLPAVGDGGSTLVPMSPMRVLDTRSTGLILDSGSPPVVVDLAAILPPTATAVAFNLTVIGQAKSGFVEVAPAGQNSASSTVNWDSAGQTVANGHISKLSADRRMQLSVVSTGGAFLVLDINGVFIPVNSASASTPATSTEVRDTHPEATVFRADNRRLYDSRNGDGPLRTGESRKINVNNVANSHATSSPDRPHTLPSAAAVNITITGTLGRGVIAIAKNATTATSTVNWSGENQTWANAVITDVAPDGNITVTAQGVGQAHVVVDLTGGFVAASQETGALFHAISPTRSYDSRVGDLLLDSRDSRVNVHPVPTDAVAVAVNTTITGNVGSGFVVMTPPGTVEPLTSTVNWISAGTTRANGSIIPATNATTRAHARGNHYTHYVQDIAGYFK